MADTPYRQTTETRPLLPLLEKYNACHYARTWAAGRTVSEDSWLACERGDWLLWIAARLGVDRRLVVAAACDCARLALAYVPEGEARPRLAIEAAERWTRGDGTSEEVRDACDAAYVAYASVSAAYAAYAAAYSSVSAVDFIYISYATAAADASATAVANASAAAAASAVTIANAFAAIDAAYFAARTATMRTCADLVRTRIPWATVVERIEASHD
jgi:hypothetical protein